MLKAGGYIVLGLCIFITVFKILEYVLFLSAIAAAALTLYGIYKIRKFFKE